MGIDNEKIRESITILHLSDIQFGRNHRFGQLGLDEDTDASFDSLFQRLGKDLDLLSKDEGLQPDLIIVSGDLAEWATKQEFDDALQFLIALSDRTGVPREKVIVIPGNHDINRKHCEGYFAICEAEGEVPKEPYWIKWKNYNALVQAFYGDKGKVIFSENEPWSLYKFEDLKVAVMAFNSTMAESHRDSTHYGWLGEMQIRWFEQRSTQFLEQQWLRVGVVHHNLIRGATDDEENLRDAEDFTTILGSSLNLVLHGHTHKDGLGWLDSNVPILSTGSAALKDEARPKGIGNQYQFIRISSNRFNRWARCYDGDQKRWIGDNRISSRGDEWRYSKEIEFTNVEGTFGKQSMLSSDVSGGSVEKLPEEPQIVQIDKNSDESRIDQNLLKSLPRFRLKVESQHLAVRKEEQGRLVAILRKQRAAWLISDWQLGKEGFLASVLSTLGGPAVLGEVYRLQCGGIKTCEELLTEAEAQLGLSFQEFFAAIAQEPMAVLVFDDLPMNIVAGSERENFDQKVRPIFDFCPALYLIFVARQEPRQADAAEIVKLRPFDAPETRQYLKNHTHAKAGLDDEYELDRIQTWSEGVPMHLDRFLERALHLPPSVILNDDSDVSIVNAEESLPHSLRDAVAQLDMTGTKQSRHSLKLLKVLTVLRDGETFQSIRRFYEREPFHPNNVVDLVNLALLEDVAIPHTATELAVYSRRKYSYEEESQKLLRIPKQVRDYVNAIISDEERSEIVQTSTGLFFGRHWWKGKIKLRTALSDAYEQSSISGPGNEHVVARLLLSKALEKGGKRIVERYGRLALMYCHKLISADRFRDALIASTAITDLLKDTEYDEMFVDAAHMQGRALRMSGREEDAVVVLKNALVRGDEFLIDENRASIKLSLALAYDDLSINDKAVETAQDVLKLIDKDSDDGFQARAIIAELTLENVQREKELVELEQKARNKRCDHAANNIALELAREGQSLDESLRLLDRVIRSASDNYNRTRAIIEKATLLSKNKRLSELGEQDQILLNAAYRYSYAQRIGNLLDRCHSVLWGMLKGDQFLPMRLRLFRFSSFIWRLRGKEEKEVTYLRELDSVDIQQLQQKEGQTLRIEIHYLVRRRQDHPVDGIELPVTPPIWGQS